MENTRQHPPKTARDSSRGLLLKPELRKKAFIHTKRKNQVSKDSERQQILKDTLPSVGSSMDVGKFGTIKYWIGKDAISVDGYEVQAQIASEGEKFYEPVFVEEQGGYHIGIEWDEPRQFQKVVVQYHDVGELPKPQEVKLQYYRHTWPPEFREGWTAIDDPFNGTWITAHCDLKAEGKTWVYALDPLDMNEIWGHDHRALRKEDLGIFSSVPYRQTLKVRLLFGDVKPRIGRIEVYSHSTWRQNAVWIEFGCGITKEQVWDGNLEVYNGYIISLEPTDNGVAVVPPNAWKCRTKGETKTIKARVLYADCPEGSNDNTLISVLTASANFSFRVKDALRESIYIKDLAVFISAGDQKADFKTTVSASEDNPKSVYDRIALEPEQSYGRASTEIPQLAKTKHGDGVGRYIILGYDSNRQEFALRDNGHVFVDKVAIKPKGRDLARLLYPGKSIHYKFATGNPPEFREREDGVTQSLLRGYLPVVTTDWNDRGFTFRQESFATLLSESPWNEEKKRGDEPLVLLTRISIQNVTDRERWAQLFFVIEPSEVLGYEEGLILAQGRILAEDVKGAAIERSWIRQPYEKPRLRAYLDIRGRGTAVSQPCSYSPDNISALDNSVVYSLKLESLESHTIEFRIPFVTLTEKEEIESLRSTDYEEKKNEIIEYWEKQINAGTTIKVPEKLLEDFYKANLWHVAVTVDKDIFSGLYMLPAGTYGYDVCANEAVHQIRSLDLRGYHDRAEKYLEPFLRLQSSRPLHGKFKTKEGVLHGLRVTEGVDYQTFNYNLDHGFVLWMLCEHYKLTGNKEWLERISSNITAACDFIKREREATKRLTKDGEKVWEYGLLPPGHLEDNPEWLYWYAVNAYAYRGMKIAAEVLAEIGHFEADRIKRDADEYGNDLMRALCMSMTLSPVVELSDGTYVPHQPTRCRLRRRDLGWIRESLYGPIHLIDCGIFHPWDSQSTWILEDAEDNVFLRPSLVISRRQIDLDKWFSHGGTAPQPNLVPTTLVYISRDQPEHAIRVFYNTFAQSIYPDVKAFAEWVPTFGIGGGPFYKTPDECAFIVWLRYLLLKESDKSLMIAPAAPRRWFEDGKEVEVKNAPTYFGTISYKITSRVGLGEIKAVIEPPGRNRLEELKVRFRHPEKKTIRSVTVNGRDHPDFDPEKEIIRITKLPKTVEIIAKY